MGFADNVILFNLEEYLDYVRTSPNYESKFIPTLREYSKNHPDGIEISILKMKFNTLDLHGIRHSEVKWKLKTIYF